MSTTPHTTIHKPFTRMPPGDRAAWTTVANLGLLGASIPTRHGGGGKTARETADLYRAAGAAEDTGVVFAAAAHLLACCMPIVEHGSPTTQKLLPQLASGELIAANAITEDGAGSDVSAIALQARPQGEGFLLSGVKSFASNAVDADIALVYARTDPEAAFLGNTAFVVDLHADGISIEPLHKMGLHGCRAGRITFNSVHVPSDQMVGERGAGGHVFQSSMIWERTCLFALYLGLAERTIDLCVTHVATRRQANVCLASHQALAHRISEMHRRRLAAYHLLYAAVDTIDQGQPDPALIAASKITASECAIDVATEAMHIFGGSGYLTSTGIEKTLRDCLPSRTFSGTNEIQHELILRGLGL